MKKTTIFTLIGILVFTSIFAQDSTGTGTGSGSATWNIETIGALVWGIYEVFVRVIPTVKSLSIVQKILDILSRLSSALDRTKQA